MKLTEQEIKSLETLCSWTEGAGNLAWNANDDGYFGDAKGAVLDIVEFIKKDTHINTDLKKELLTKAEAVHQIISNTLLPKQPRSWDSSRMLAELQSFIEVNIRKGSE